MEERIIDDEYGRGIRLKKTKDGYVDVTDELAADNDNAEEVMDAEEISFQFPETDDGYYDERYAELTPEQAAELRKQQAEEIARQKAEYERTCREGEELLASGSFKSAELKFEKALQLDGDAMEASVGYWRAKTANFTQPDVLADEYVKSDNPIEDLEYDLGFKAVDKIKQDYRSVFEKRLETLKAEETPLAEKVESKQASRRAYLKERFQKAMALFIAVTVPFLVALGLTVMFGLKNFTTPDTRYVTPTIVLGCIAFVLFIVFLIFTNKFLNAARMRRANEKLSSTDDGEELLEIRRYKAWYEQLLIGRAAFVEEEREEIDETEENEENEEEK